MLACYDRPQPKLLTLAFVTRRLRREATETAKSTHSVGSVPQGFFDDMEPKKGPYFEEPPSSLAAQLFCTRVLGQPADGSGSHESAEMQG